MLTSPGMLLVAENYSQMTEKIIYAIVSFILAIIILVTVQNSEPTVTAVQTNNKWGIELSEDEEYELARVVWLEAGGASDACQQAVVEVVFNRVLHWGFADYVLGVLSEKGQFVVWNYRDEATPGERAYANIRAVLNGETDWTNFNTVYFATFPLKDDIELVIDGVYFCNQE